MDLERIAETNPCVGAPKQFVEGANAFVMDGGVFTLDTCIDKGSQTSRSTKSVLIPQSHPTDAAADQILKTRLFGSYLGLSNQ